MALNRFIVYQKRAPSASRGGGLRRSPNVSHFAHRFRRSVCKRCIERSYSMRPSMKLTMHKTSICVRWGVSGSASSTKNDVNIAPTPTTPHKIRNPSCQCEYGGVFSIIETFPLCLLNVYHDRKQMLVRRVVAEWILRSTVAVKRISGLPRVQIAVCVGADTVADSGEVIGLGFEFY